MIYLCYCSPRKLTRFCRFWLLRAFLFCHIETLLFSAHSGMLNCSLLQLASVSHYTEQTPACNISYLTISVLILLLTRKYQSVCDKHSILGISQKSLLGGVGLQEAGGGTFIFTQNIEKSSLHSVQLNILINTTTTCTSYTHPVMISEQFRRHHILSALRDNIRTLHFLT